MGSCDDTAIVDGELPGLRPGREGHGDPAAAPRREPMDERVGDEHLGDEREYGRRAHRQGFVRCLTGEPRTARSAEPRGKIVAKVPQMAVERHLGRARDTEQERADRRRAHDTGRKLAQGEQAVHRSQALLERVRGLPAEGALAGVRGRTNAVDRPWAGIAVLRECSS